MSATAPTVRPATRAACLRPVLRAATPTVVVSTCLLAIIVVFAIAAPLLPFYHPHEQNLADAELGMFSRGQDGNFHLLGTDPLGVDSLSQLMQGGRVSLQIAVCAVVIAALIGPLMGALAGYYGGVVERIIVGLVDIQLALPRILIVITVVAVVGAGTWLLTLLIGLTGWAVYARVVRAQTLSLRRREFVDAAISMGSSDWRIMLRHLLPNNLNAIVVLASLDIGNVVVTEAALSYLGLGVRPPDTSWGLMIQKSQDYLQTDLRLLLLPSIALICLVVSINFVARSFTSERELRGSRTLTTTTGG